ncbi:MAG: FAD-binding oxidoreductase [Verrucomicrobiota bacterium]
MSLDPNLKLSAATKTSGVLVNDVHSQLNTTRVGSVLRPETYDELINSVSSMIKQDLSISICGSRHAMGGQQFGEGTELVDLTALDKIIHLDREEKIVEVEAGITWPKLIAWLNLHAPELSIIQKQTGADELTLGGALAANIHGRGLSQRPIIENVESFAMLNAKGERINCSRAEESELFKLAIGGYGLFGIILSIKLRLTNRIKLERIVETRSVEGLVQTIEQRVSNGYVFGDLQYMTDSEDMDFMRQGVFSCYKPAAPDAEVAKLDHKLSEADWQNLYLLAHVDKGRAFKTYKDYYAQTNGQIYWYDHHQQSIYLKNQNQKLNQRLGYKFPSSLMISELYVPRSRLHAFMENIRLAARKQKMDIIYGTIRFIEKDEESFLAWAKEPYACIIFNLHVVHSTSGIEKAKFDFRRLIDEALQLGGSFYLTYHKWARKDQVLQAYPQFPDFLVKKKLHDPEIRFTSDWYRHYARMFL